MRVSIERQLLASVLLAFAMMFLGCQDEATLEPVQDEPYFAERPFAGGPSLAFHAWGNIGIAGKMFHFADREKVYYLNPRFASVPKVNACFTDYYTTYIETDVVIEPQAGFSFTGNLHNSCTSSERSYQMFGDMQINGGSASFLSVILLNYGDFFETECQTGVDWLETVTYENIVFSPTTWYGGLANDETVSGLSLTENYCSGSYNIAHAIGIANDDFDDTLTVTRWKLSCYAYNP